jgi:hypothetical protein
MTPVVIIIELVYFNIFTATICKKLVCLPCRRKNSTLVVRNYKKK